MQRKFKPPLPVLVAALIVLMSAHAPCETPTALPALSLEGSGQCYGPFRTSRTQYSWTLAWGRNNARILCSSTYRVLSHPSEFDWVLGVEQTKQCPFSVIHVWKYDPDQYWTTWSLSAYERDEQMKSKPDIPYMACGGMSDLTLKP